MEAEHLPNEVFDRTLLEAVRVLVDDDPSLLDPPEDFGNRYTPQSFGAHLTRMVQEVDDKDYRRLPQDRLAKWCSVSTATIRGILGRHPLIPKVQATRAALELKTGTCGTPVTGVIKTFAGVHDTTASERGVHRFDTTGPPRGRQVHLDFIVITDSGRSLLVSTERFGVEDVTSDAAMAYARAATRSASASGLTGSALLAMYEQHISTFYREQWGRHRTGATPQTVSEHIQALICESITAASLVGAAEIFSDLPIVGGQLVATTNRGALPVAPSLALVGHDLASTEQLLAHRTLPVLDLNYVEGNPCAVSVLPFTVRLPGARGVTPHNGEELLGVASDPNRATVVSREDLGLNETEALKIAVSFVDGEVDLPTTGAHPVRVYYRGGYSIPQNLYLVPMVPDDAAIHSRAIAAIIADSTDLYAGQTGRMSVVRDSCVRKGAFDVGGRKASPAESLASIARIAADRQMHREFWHARESSIRSA